jgi:two-component system NtrC family sensor kinase
MSGVLAKLPVRATESMRLQSILDAQVALIQPGLALDPAMQLCAEQALTLTAATGALVSTLEGDEVVARAGAGTLAEHGGLRLGLRSSLTGECLRSGLPILCLDCEADARTDHGVARRLGVRSMILTPLQHQGRVVGVLKVSAPKTNAFDQTDVQVLSMLGAALSAALVRISDEESREQLVREREASLRKLESDAAMLKETMRALETAQARSTDDTWMVQTVVQTAPLLFGLVELEGEDDYRHLIMNAEVAKLFGVTPEQGRGRLASELRTPPEVRELTVAKMRKIVASGQGDSYDYWRKTGSTMRHLSVTAWPVPSASGRRCCYLMADTTEGMKSKQRTEVAERMATVGRLAAGVAHEVNNPLAFVLSNLTFAMEELAAAPQPREDVVEALREARDGAERVKHIVRELHTFSTSSQLQSEPLDLSEVIQRAVGLAGYALKTQAQVSLELREERRPMGHPARLGQVILNLLINAAQAMPSNRNEAENQIHVSTRMALDGRALIQIVDNGKGMTPELRARIFDPFFTTQAVGEGTGLGLSISLNIVREHGGELVVDSTEGIGTTFQILLPV